jgi:hypothetical protein
MGTYGGVRKVSLALDNISEAIATDIPIVCFIPMCLRYYYDTEGDQQILPDLETHQVISKSGEIVTKSGSEFKNKIVEDINKILILKSLGVPIEVIMPVMDHEILRPERMNTDINKEKIRSYLKSLSEYLNQNNLEVSLQSSLHLFGIPKEHAAFKDMLDDIRESTKRIFYGESKFGISDKTFEHTVNEEHERNSKDTERNNYYRSREFARLCREHDFGEARVHTVEMCRLANARGYKGCFIKLPLGAEIDMLVFNTEENVVVTF